MTPWSSFLGDETFAIFLFHGVVAEHRHLLRNYTRKHVDRTRFAEILDDLTAHGSPIALDDVLEGDVPPGAFVITFDDGFANNLTVAAPILGERGVPATFYVTTEFLQAGSGSWIDQIEHAFSAVDSVSLSLPPAGPGRAYHLLEEKRELLDAVRAYVKSTRDLDPYAYAAAVRRELHVEPKPNDADLDRKLTWEEARQLDADPLFTIGGHGHTHRILEWLRDDELAEEIDRSLTMLRAELKRPIRHYSYPEGQADCYSDRVIALLQSRGIVCSPSAEAGVNRAGDDPFRLKRLLVT